MQKGMLRLLKALESIKPNDVRAYFGLAARQLRFVIADLAEQYRGRQPFVSLEQLSEPSCTNSSHEPTSLLEWSEFHQAVAQLPDEERETFDLLFYGGMEQLEAAALLGISERTLRRWASANYYWRSGHSGKVENANNCCWNELCITVSGNIPRSQQLTD